MQPRAMHAPQVLWPAVCDEMLVLKLVATHVDGVARIGALEVEDHPPTQDERRATASAHTEARGVPVARGRPAFFAMFCNGREFCNDSYVTVLRNGQLFTLTLTHR